MSYYAVTVTILNGPTSVRLDAETAEEAVEAFEALGETCNQTDAEDDLGIDGSGMSEEEFDDALIDGGAHFERPLGDDWYLWSAVRWL
jgi:hypothetical protein